MLCALSDPREYHCFYIRSFEDGKVNRYELMNGNSIMVQVQHGDVVFINWRGQFASFINEEFHCTGLSETERFEYIKSFFYASRHCRFQFAAIVENDGHEEPKGSEVNVEETNEEVKDERQVLNGEEKLQES